jgi:hypothetical protein
MITTNVCLTTVNVYAPLSYMLHSHEAITICLYQLAENLNGGYTESYCYYLCGTEFPMLLPLHTDISPEQQLTNSCTVCCMLPLPKELPPTEK